MSEFATEICCLKKTDIPALSEMVKMVMLYPWSQAVFYDCLKANYHGWVLIKNDGAGREIIGFSIVLVQLDECHILNICIASKFQSKGYGKQLLKHIVHFSKSKKLIRILLEVRISNKKAIVMYRDFKFREVGIRKNYYPCEDSYEDGLIFMLNL